MWPFRKMYFSDDWDIIDDHPVYYYDDNYFGGYAFRITLRHKRSGKAKALKIGNGFWTYNSMHAMARRAMTKYGIKLDIETKTTTLFPKP